MDVQRLYRQRVAEAKTGDRTRLAVHVTLRRALGQALRWGLVTANAATLVDPPRYRAPAIRPLSADDAYQLLAAAKGDRLEALYVTALYTGMRWGELCGLHWGGR